jgi:dihydrolipoamide dehydrogenase
MSLEVVVPEISDGVTAGTVVAIAVAVADQVEADQTLMELETDKAVVSIPAPQAGTIAELRVAVGDQAAVGAVILVLSALDEMSTEAESGIPTAEVEQEEPAQIESQTESNAAVAAPPCGKAIVVIGAGPGGYAAAFKAAELGLEVTLIDPELHPGGVCLHRGCIPSKALLHVAKLVSEAEDAAKIGVAFTKPRLDIDRIRAWKNEIIEKLTTGLGTKVLSHKINYRRGTAEFADAKTLDFSDHNGQKSQIAFDQAIIATGSCPVSIPGVELGERIIDSTGALELADVPKSMLVVGGGYIGLELGSAYAALGTRVSVVEMMPDLMAGCDRDLASILMRRLEPRFEDIMLKTRVLELKEQKNAVAVTLENRDAEQIKKRYEKVLIAIGRRPNVAGLGLENTRVQLTERGFIAVDAQQRTAEPHIFAVGDIAGDPLLAHKAYAEARVAAEVAAGRKALFDPRAIPAVVFTDPEIAWCGLTEIAARENKIGVKVAKFPWRGNGRAQTLGRDDGMTKLIVDPATDRILGVAVAGPGAGELIAEGVLALEMAALAEDLRHSIHPHPTLSETLYEAAEMLFKP